MANDLASAQADLTAGIAELRSSMTADPSLLGLANQQLAQVSSLKGQLATSGPTQLAAMSAQIASVVQSATALVRQAQQAAATSAVTPAVASASQAARAAVNDFENDFYQKKIFDPYLKFASPEDEAKYRRDEAERKEQIEKALALHTPEGDLLANKLSLDQLKDAGAHGADQSPDYEPMRHKLQASQDALSAAITSTTPVPRTADAPTKDIADDVQPAVRIPSEVLAALRATGVKQADTAGEGHGVTASKAQASTVGLGA